MRCTRILLPLVSFVLGLAVSSNSSADEQPNALSRAEIADGWILLFDGKTDFGWKAATKANWKVADGMISVSEGEKGLLCTTSEFGDYVLKVDFRADKNTNSGIFLRTAAQPTNPAADCYELNIAPDDNPFPTGGFVARKKSEGGHTTGDWQSFEVTTEGSHFQIKLDGKLVLDYTDPKPLPRGLIGLQLNSGPVAFRNIKLKPLGLKPIFNARDLSGWKNHPESKSVFSVTPKGELNVKNGRGLLESEARFGDFVLQFEAFSNGNELNSGIFFRSIPGEFANGYESQIHNGYKDGDRSKPKDFGTGGIYRRQPARKVVPNDFEWFANTLVVSGNHMAVWVDGYQVTDWTDTRAPNANPRQGLRLEAGTLGIQGHDPTTDLLFRNLKAGELPGHVQQTKPPRN
jgi:hypothetical protein